MPTVFKNKKILKYLGKSFHREEGLQCTNKINFENQSLLSEK